MMKKLLFLFAAALVVANALTACDDDVAKNPGDFSLKPTLEIEPVVTSITGTQYQLSKVREIDTTYVYFYLKEDTARDASGEFVIGPDGNYVVTVDTVYYNSKITAKFTEYGLVTLPAPADTFRVALKSNSKWKAPVPGTGGKVQWFYNYNILTGATTTAGGGDGEVNFRVSRNRNKNPRAVVAVQDILTEDSTVMVRLRFMQEGESN